MMKRKRYNPEYKREIVELDRQSRSGCRQVALEVGVTPNMLTRWVREADAEGGKAFPAGGTPRDEDVARLKRELSRVTRESDFLKDAAAYFAKQSPNGTRWLSAAAANIPSR